MEKTKPSGLADILYNTENHSRRDAKPSHIMDDLDLPKHKITNPELFAKGREVLGNLISRRMKTSGGTDIDWLIEHNGGFMIFELKTFHDNRIIISRAQMSAYERLYYRLPLCRILFIGHDDIDFRNLNDSVWLFEMQEWKSGKIPHVENAQSDPTGDESPTFGYTVEREFMEEIDVKILRDRIDSIWLMFESKKNS